MKAIILAAGQGKRLLPETVDLPKSLLDVGGRSMIAWQIQEFVKCGIDEIVVVTGFRAERTEKTLNEIAKGYPETKIRVLVNPEYETSDNLVSCWAARAEMNRDFVLVNGDTLFQAPVLRKLLRSTAAPVTLASDDKEHYDEDDMKIRRVGSRLMEIGKDLPLDTVDGESIGLLLFRGDGPQLFARALEAAREGAGTVGRWYLSVIGTMAKSDLVRTCSIAGLEWCEVDYPLDLVRARQMIRRWQKMGWVTEISATTA